MGGCQRVVTEQAPKPTGTDKETVASFIAKVAFLAVLLPAAAMAGWVFERLGVPLPWMIGPLILTACVYVSGAAQRQMPNRMRIVGQVVVACQVGLTFSPAALQQLATLWPYLIGSALLSGLCILGVSWLMSRMGHLSIAQSFLSMVPTSPVEAANLAIRSGIDPMPVVVSQVMRLALVVILVPFAMYALDGWPTDVTRNYVTLEPFALPPVVLLAAVGAAGALAVRLMRISNPNFLGPLALAAILSSTGYGPQPFPDLVLAGAQVILGTWLGSNFRRDFLQKGGRLVAVSFVCTLVLLLTCGLMAGGLAYLAGHDWRVFVLGAAPGGVTEMALTAKFLGQTVALVAAFHVVRIFIFIPNIPWVVGLIDKLEKRRNPPPSP